MWSREDERASAKRCRERDKKHKLKRYSPKGRYKELIRRCKTRRLNFDLTETEYCSMIDKNCSYCGKSLMQETGSSLDRIDNDKGYVSGNVVPCCKHCNYLKGTLVSETEMREIIKVLAISRSVSTDKIWEGVRHMSDLAHGQRSR